MEITITSIKILSREDLLFYFKQLSQFMKKPLDLYWNTETNEISENYKLPFVRFQDPLFKTWKIEPISKGVIEICERIEHHKEIINNRRLRRIL